MVHTFFLLFQFEYIVQLFKLFISTMLCNCVSLHSMNKNQVKPEAEAMYFHS